VVGRANGISLAVGGLFVAAVLAPAPAGAASILPNTTTDERSSGGSCSLREAVDSINAGADAGGCVATGTYGDSDGIGLGAGTYELTLPGVDDTNAGGDLDLTKAAAISGTGDEVGGTVIDANQIDRAIDGMVNASANVNVQIFGLRVENGSTDSDGGAIRTADPDANTFIQNSTVASSQAGERGGGLATLGAGPGGLLIARSEFVGNVAGDDGGGVYRAANLAVDAQVQESLFDHNSAAEGGGVYQEGSLSLLNVATYRNTTFSGNTGTMGGGAVGLGVISTVADLRFVTFAGNSTPAPGGGGALNADGAAAQVVSMQGTVFAGNTANGVDNSCSAPMSVLFEDRHYNLESGNTCHLATGPPSFSLIDTDALLAPLADNGGETWTHGLYDTSPALDRIPNTAPECGTPAQGIDQRNVSRPDGTACDVGAFEGSVGPVPPPPSGGGLPPATSSPAPAAKRKRCKKQKKRSSAEAAKKKKCKKKKRK
jgi:hypothetical protein